MFFLFFITSIGIYGQATAYGNISCRVIDKPTTIKIDNIKTGELGNYSSVFCIEGKYNTNYCITLSKEVTIQKTGKSESVEVNNLTTLASQDGLLDPKGQGTIVIGATLNISPDQKPGVYNSLFEIKLNYY